MFEAAEVKNRIVSWIRDFFKTNGNDNTPAVIGISGGKDSSVVTALCVEALGKERVIGVLMPRGEQHDIDVSIALCKVLGIKSFTVNIGGAVNNLFKEFESAGGALNSVATINTPARIRMSALYMVANAMGGRVSNNSNLSETYVGYDTKFGDSAGDFSPLSKLTVTEVKAVGYALGLDSKFIEKVPEDGLCGKTDEENMGFTYDILDFYIRNGHHDDLKAIQKIESMHAASRHKFNPMPAFEL